MFDFLVFDDSGKLLGVHKVDQAPPAKAGIHYWQTDDPEILADPDRAVPTFGPGGEVVSVSLAPPQEIPTLWLHGSISGGTVNQLTGTRYLERGNTLTYSAAIHVGSDSGSAQVTEVPGSDPPEPLSGSWALECIHELDIDQFSPMVTMTAGVISGSVIIPDRLKDGLYTLPEDRMAALAGVKLRLADPAAFEFKVRS